nr:hypothetical protein [Myxococcales bacterium]
MGGIVGFFCRGGLSLPDRAQFVRQTELLTARGPDDDGSISIDPPYGLGSRRPLAEGITHQPLWDGERRVGVVLDGGFDNIQALRTMLRDRGHRTSLIDSASVLLAAYREWGDRCVDHLSGDFALAVVDRRAKVVLLAREALGRCPLYYYWDRDYFCFASEVQALLGDSAVSRVLEPNAVYRWFACGWCEPDSCLLQGVHTVGPGEALVVDAERIRVRRYWTLGEVTTGHDGGALRQLRDELRHAALRHSSAIVALSGGRISSFLAVLRKQQLGQARSFSLPGFNLEDRRECVRLTSEFDLANSEIGAADPRGVLEAALNSMDLPIGSLSYLGHVAWAEALRLAKRTE